MKCPNCQAENSPLASLCHDCGQALQLTVPPQAAPVTAPRVLISPEERQQRLRRAAQTADQRVALAATDPEAALVEPADSMLLTDPPHPVEPIVSAPPSPVPAASIDPSPTPSLPQSKAVTTAGTSQVPVVASTPDLSRPDLSATQTAQADAIGSETPVPAMDAELSAAQINVHRRVVLASLYKRALAGAVDLLIVAGVTGIYLWVAISRLQGSVGPAKGVGFDRLIDGLWVYHQVTIPAGAVLLILISLFQIIFVGLLGQTPGMMWMRLHVLSTQQRKLGFARSALRGLILALGILPLGLGWSWAIMDPQRRCWHDRLAKTLVGTAIDEVTTLLPSQVAEAQ